MPKVFISHSTRDRAFVEREIVAPLRAGGIETWYARASVRVAVEWERSIKKGLKECDWFLVVMSPRSVVSRWVRAEVHWAMTQREGRFVPVLVEDCELDDLHLFLPQL